MSRSSGGARARATAAPSGTPAEGLSFPTVDAALVERRHFVWLIEALRRRIGGDLAEDLAQEAWLRLARGTGPIRNPRALLMTVAMNLARDQFRRDRIRADHLEHSPDRLLQESGVAASAEDDLHLKQVILSLPPKLRDVLLLSRIGGLTNREIAQRFGLSVRAVDKRLQKAIMLFVARLRD